MSDREFDSLSDTVEFFDLRIFSLCELLWQISASEFVKATVNTAKYARNTLLLLICIYRGFRESAVIIRYRDSLCKIYSTRISILIRCHALRFQDSGISFPVVSTARISYCILGNEKINAWRPHGNRARVSVNFRKFSPCIARARRARAGLTVYPPSRTFPNQAEVSKVDYSSKANSSNVRDSLTAKNAVLNLPQLVYTTKFSTKFSTKGDALKIGTVSICQ